MRTLFARYSYIANELQQELADYGIYKDIRIIMSKHLNVSVPVGPFRRFIKTNDMKELIKLGSDMLMSIEVFYNVVKKVI